VVTGFKTGLPLDKSQITLASVPWANWYRTLLFWVPMIAFRYVAMIALMTILHKQWSQREHLRYPSPTSQAN
jgi:hypothetical protein